MSSELVAGKYLLIVRWQIKPVFYDFLHKNYPSIHKYKDKTLACSQMNKKCLYSKEYKVYTSWQAIF